MATAAKVLTAALQRVIVQASEAELEQSEFQDAIFAMNNFMLSLDADGIRLGYTEVTTLGDEITIPTGALRGLIANVAIDISPDYGGNVSPALVLQAKEGLKVMTKLGVRIAPSAFPGTLPRGSGNDADNSRISRFFPDLEAEILAESTGAIGLEVNTAAVIAGETIPEETTGITWNNLNEETWDQWNLSWGS